MDKIKILIVEDSKTFNKTIASLLRNLEYEVSQAFNFKEAKNFISTTEFDFILLDLLLPDGEGDDLIYDIKEASSAKIIVLSGTSDIQRRNYLFEHGGVIDYFSKDIPLKLLINDINNTIKTIYTNENFNILVVDDSAFVRRTISDVLKMKNYNVITANDPLEALETLKVQNIDLVLSDLEMPHMSGVEFIEELKKDNKYKELPVMILSSSDNREDYARVLKHGAVDFIKKPFVVEEILLKCDLHINYAKFVKRIAIQAKELDEYKRVLDESDIVSKSDLKGKITYTNKMFQEISGYTQEELIGKQHNFVRHPDMPKEVFKEMWEKIQNKETFKGIVKNRRKDGTSYYVDATIVPILDIQGNIKEYVGVRHNITDIMNPKKQFLDDISISKEPISIMAKIVNYNLLKEFYGEHFVQKLEEYISSHLIKLLPEISNINKVYHLDNGEYAFLRELGENELDCIIGCLEEFNKNVSSYEFIVDDTKVDISLHITFTTDKDDAFENLKLGIRKLQKEKKTVVCSNKFAAKNRTKAKNNMKTAQMLKNAIENDNGKLISHFQPIVDNKTNEIARYESLARLISEDGAIVSPFFFIDIAKRAGYYNSITDIVIDNSFKALDETNKGVTINLSTLDIENFEIRNKLLGLISKPQYHSRVTFELLEDEVANDFDTIKGFINLAKTVGGVKIAIDDFGSGYSNFERLLDFQPDILKIDGSLIKNIVDDSFSGHVVEAIVLFAKKENIKTVAEFVSDEKIFEKVKQMGIDYSQGFYLGKPDTLN